MLIVADQDVWRAECIAAIGWDQEKTVQIFPVNSIESVDYHYNTTDEAARAYKSLLEAWKNELQA